MASTHIEINANSTRLSAELRTSIQAAQKVREQVAWLKDRFDQLAVGEDWAALAYALGIESTTDAETVYNLHVAANTALQAVALDTFCDRLG